MKNSIFLFLWIFNLEVLTYNQIYSQLCTATINQAGKYIKGWG